MHKKKILLVDDEVNLAKYVMLLLRSYNYNVDVVHSGSDALVKSKQNPDLIVLDLSLPDINGLEVCRQIKNDMRLRNIPIIMLSSNDTSTDKVRSLYIGADDYITKPFDSEELLARIEVALRRTHFLQRAQEDKEALVNALKKILKEESITPFFQPIISVKSRRAMGLEVLSRPSTEGLIDNPEFLFRAALSFGMYTRIETLSWRKAIIQWKASVNQGKLFLNCTPYFIEGSQVDKAFFLNEDIDPHNVVLEITERTAIHDYDLFLAKLKEFKDLGIKIAVDDVGSGYASLDLVAEVKPDYVKIDMPLIRKIHMDSLKRNIVEAIITFCKKSKIISIAEGVENESELKIVSKLGVNAVQGYLISRPKESIDIDIFTKKMIF
jgi:EAL domain-containing protein (putative c-di-GMP-specific phosphodiesterase class I)